MKIFGKKLLTLIALITLGSAIWGIWYYTQPNFFPIKHIKIFANYEHVDKKNIQDIIATYTTQGFFYLRVDALKKQLLQLPWIYALAIRREWPETLVVNIAEEHAIAYWGDKALINTHGTIFTPPIATFPPDLPILFGSEERAADIFNLYKKMVTVLEPLDLTIKKLTLHPEHFWILVLNNNTVISLKENDPLSQLNLLVSVYRKITTNHNNQDPKYIDLRYKSGFAVKWE